MLRRNTQSVITILITSVTVATLLIAITVLNVLTSGIEESKRRFGADIVIISAKTKLGTRAFLFSGEFADKYIDKNDLEFLKNYDEIEKTTEEFFTHTLSAGCCTVGEKLRIVGINQKSDFLVKPWLEEREIKYLNKSQVLIGSDVIIPLGSKMGLLGAPFTLVGSLYRTGTSMDRTIYMDIEVARKLAKKKMQPGIFMGKEPEELVTSLFIKLKPGSDVQAVTKRINNEQEEVIAASKADTISKLENSLKGWYLVLIFLVSVVVINSILSLFGRFNFMMKERKREIGYLRSLGMSKVKVFLSLLYEIMIIALAGGVCGSLVVLVVINIILEIVSIQFLTPKTTVDFYNIMTILIAGPVLSFLIGLISAGLPIWNSAKMEPREAMAKGAK